MNEWSPAPEHAAPGSRLVLFLGTVRRGEFEPLQSRGIPLGVLIDTNSKHRLGDVTGFALVERFDFSRPLPELIEAVKTISKRHPLACVFNVIEFYVAHAAGVAAALGLASITPAAARLCLDKSLMRQRFLQQVGHAAAARFHVVESETDLLRSAERLGYPVFLQPANVSASMWSTRNDAPGTLLANYRAMRDEVPRYYERLGQKDKVLVAVVAEFLEGDNTSIDCLVDASGRVHATPPVDVLTGRDVGLDDFHHFARIVPSRLDQRLQRELEQLAAAGVRALDMTSAAAHVEFIGSRLGEIAARPGGNRPRILDLAFGIDVLHGYYQVLCGLEPDLRPTTRRAAAIVTPFAPRNGTLRAIHGLERVAALPGYHYHEVRAQPGQAVGLARSGHRAPLYVELVSEDGAEVRRSVDEMASWSDLYALE